jgi:hypothetical protein
MRRFLAVDSIEVALLATLGLAPACGGATDRSSVVQTTSGSSGGTSGSGSGATGTSGSSGASGTSGTSSGATDSGTNSGTSSGATDSGTSGTSSGTSGAPHDAGLQSCVDPMPIVMAGVDTGFDTCQGNTVRRRAVVDCPSAIPRSAPLTSCQQTAGGYGCTADTACADAGPNAYCGPFAQNVICECMTGCVRDSDCPSGNICRCGAPIGQCVPAGCTTDASCPSGSECIEPDPNGGGFYCQTPNDQCFADSDCPPTIVMAAECTTRSICEYSDTAFACGVHMTCVTGRPFLVHRRERLAETAARSDWAAAPHPNVSATPAARAALAEHWTRTGLMEHASIAAFARFTLHLLALGAPQGLVKGASEALSDETEHARLAFGLASAYAGAPIGPGPLSIEGALDGFDDASFLATLVREGCIGETLAAAEARDAFDAVQDPQVRAVLDRIAVDELNHAALAWRTLAWLVASGHVSRSHARSELATALRETATAEPAPFRSSDDLAPFGLPDDARRRDLRRATCARVVARCAEQMLPPTPFAAQLRRDPLLPATTREA